MYARHVTYHAEPGKRERVIGIIEALMPHVRRQAGFVDILMLVDEANDEYVGVSRWKTRADAEAVTIKILPLVIEELASVLDSPPTVRIYEVHDSQA
jgi:heme-degrading monooxygenase HmoA